MRGRFDSANIYFIELLHVTQDAFQLSAELLLFRRRERQPGEAGNFFDIDFNFGHFCYGALRALGAELHSPDPVTTEISFFVIARQLS